MRLLLLPISTRQSLIYCQRLNQQFFQKAPSYLDRITTKATTTWLGWEKKGRGWQKKVTTYGNTLFQRLPYDEYCLKSIPPLSERRKNEEVEGKEVVQVEYPLGLIEEPKVQEALRKLGSNEKQAFHTKWLIGSVIGMPISAPLALIPVIPNLPFFYLCFRAWSHWRARAGSKHLEFLLDKQLIRLQPSKALQFAYAEAVKDKSVMHMNEEFKSIGLDTRIGLKVRESKEEMLLSASSGAVIADQMKIPEIQMELDRAVWQVERGIKTQHAEMKEEEKGIDSTHENLDQRR